MQNAVARKSQEKSASHQSQSFQDLQFNQSAPFNSNNKIQAETQTTLQSNQKYQQEVIKYLKNQNEKLTKQVNILNQKLNIIDDEKAKFEQILQLVQKQNTSLSFDVQQLLLEKISFKERLNNYKQQVQKLSKATHLSQIKLEQIKILQNKVNSLQQQLSFYQKEDQHIRTFLKSQLNIQFNSSKTTKFIVQSIISQMSQNRNQISEQISQLIHIAGQIKKQNHNENYNHWKQMQKLSLISEFIIKSKNKSNNEKH